MNQHLETVIIIAAVFLFAIYRRIRRNIGWQPLNSRRIIVRTIIFCFIGLIFLAGGATHLVSLISDVIGILIGIILAYYSGAMTNFEQRNGAWYYRPNTWIGSMVTALFLGRLIYRFYQMYLLENSGAFKAGQQGGVQNMNYAMGNSWTSGLMLIMFAYYAIYYVIILRYHQQAAKAGENFRG